MAKRKESKGINFEHKVLHTEEVILEFLDLLNQNDDQRNIKNITIYELREFMHNKDISYLHSNKKH